MGFKKTSSKTHLRYTVKELLESKIVKNNPKLQEKIQNFELEQKNVIKKRIVHNQEYNKDVFLSNCKNKYKFFKDIEYINILEEQLDLYIYENNEQGKLLQLIYRIPAKELNINRKLNWVKKHKFAYADKEYGYIKTKNILYKLNLENINLKEYKLSAEIEYYVYRNIDDDNLDGTFKHMRDGIYLALGIDDKIQISSKRTVNKIKTKSEYLILTLNKML